MRVLSRVLLCIVVFTGISLAQRGGMGGGGGARGGVGMAGGGVRGGFGGGSIGGGFRGGIGGGVRGGIGGGSIGGGFRGGLGGGFVGGVTRYGGLYGFNNAYRHSFFGGYAFPGYAWPGYFPSLGVGFGYWPSYYGYDYGYYGSPYAYGYGYTYPDSYAASPNVTVVYPQATQASAPATTVYVERAHPVTHEYDQYGQEISPAAPGASSSPIYLIAFKDHVIRAAASYWVDGSTLHYVTLQHEEKQVPLDTLDRDFSMQLNRERHVSFNLPQ
jgi:hypothetical protein